MSRIFGYMVAVAVALVIGVALWRSMHSNAGEGAPSAAAEAPGMAAPPTPVRFDPSSPAADCEASVAFAEAARRNDESAAALRWSPFGRAETGWLIYAPLVAYEIGSGCGPATSGFAERLAAWQQANGFRPDGVLTPAQFETMKRRWSSRRPYVAVRARGVCPDPPAEAALARAEAQESYGGKTILLRPDALAAYRRMVAAARDEVPGLKDQPQMLDIFSAYRSPAYDAARCERDRNCQGVTRARCSAHRTGLALDLVMGSAPGFPVDSSADPNRLAMTQTAAYRWMIANASRFGFVNYPFEPWHWEWTGEGAAERKPASNP